MQPALSIVVVNWNTRDHLARCLCSLDRVALDRDRVELFVVDNASADGSGAMVAQRFGWAQLIANEENVGFARANNQAILRSQGRYVLLLNSDTEIWPGAAEQLLAFMDAHPKAGAAGARLLNADGSLQHSCHPMLTPEREFWRLTFLDRLAPKATYDMERWEIDRPRPVDVIKGACLLLRRAALDEVGVLDEGYFMYTEEVDLCYRLVTAGWERWWVPQATVVHYGGASARQAAQEMYVHLYRSKVQFYRKFGGPRQVRRFKRLVRLAYWPRLLLSTAGAPFSGRLSQSARTYRRLLGELPAM